MRAAFTGPGPACAAVHSAFARLRPLSIPALLDITPAYATLLLEFDPATLDPAGAELAVREALRALDAVSPSAPKAASTRFVEIPACYAPECAPDIAQVAGLHGLTTHQVATLHAGAEYTVAFIGFSPGFPYLVGLPDRLATPRLSAPRPRVPAGSIAIGGDQAGIYPSATPGGWRLIGRTPLRLFDPAREPPSLLTIGDRVRFTPITLEAFRAALPESP